MPTLTIQLPGLPPVEHVLREEAITLGRMKGNTIALDDSSISLSHAKITRLGHDYFLKDLNSTNGTMLNGQSISEARLRDGDHLKFGEVVAVFRVESSLLALPAPTSALAENPTAQVAAQTVAGLVALAAPPPAPRPAIPPAPAWPPKPHTAPPPQPAQIEVPPPTADPAPRPRRRKPISITLLAPVLGGLSALCMIGFAISKFTAADPAPDESAPPPKQTSTPQPAPRTAPKPAPPVERTKAAGTSRPTEEMESVAPPPADPAMATLIADLKSSDVVARRAAAQAISAMEAGAKPAVPALRASLRDADSEVRMWSALALVNNQTYDKAAIPILVQILKHESSTLRQVACISLALIPYEPSEKAEVVAALKPLIASDPSPEVRNDALTALKVIAPNAAGDK